MRKQQRRDDRPLSGFAIAADQPHAARSRPAKPALPSVLTPGAVLDLQRSVGNRATTALIARPAAGSTGPGVTVQRHDTGEDRDIDELDATLQRLTTDEEANAHRTVRAALTDATRTKKRENPLKYNTGKAFTKGGYRYRIVDNPSAKAQVSGEGSDTVDLGAQWVLKSAMGAIQGALAHELSHLMRTDQDSYKDEFDAYWKEVQIGSGTLRDPAQLPEKLQLIHSIIENNYGWVVTAPKETRARWSQLSALTGYNVTNSWKQAKLKKLMNPQARERGDTSPPAPNGTVGEVLAHIRKMNSADKTASRDAERVPGEHYLRYDMYAEADRNRIWAALGGQGTAPSR